MAKIDRVATGIAGFDELVEGGFIRDSTVLLSGGCGTGKTIFSLQYLYNGATKYNEPGVFLSFEEDPESLQRDVSNFGMDLNKLQKAGKLILSSEEPYNLEKISKTLEDHVTKINARRLVIDSTSVFGLYLESPHEVRVKLFDLVRLLRKLDVTTILVSEIVEGSGGLSRFGVEEFVCDGVVVMYYMGVGEVYARSLMIRKMRATNHSEDIHPIEIGKQGLVVEKAEEVYRGKPQET